MLSLSTKTRVVLAGLAGFSLLAGLAGAAWAQAQPPSQDRKTIVVSVPYRICGPICAKRFQACGSGAGCDTAYVGCTMACEGCEPGVAACLGLPDADVKACQAPLEACVKTALSKRTGNRPLIRFGGGDGASLETAVIVSGAMSEAEGVTAEDVWIAKTHPMWRKQSQAMIVQGPKLLDQINYDGPDGKHEIWFDITSFFGKP